MEQFFWSLEAIEAMAEMMPKGFKPTHAVVMAFVVVIVVVKILV